MAEDAPKNVTVKGSPFSGRTERTLALPSKDG